jgi:hypothetical protein
MRLNADRRRAIALLANSAGGCTEAVMQAHGFAPTLIGGLIRAGLATAKADWIVAGGRSLEVRRLQITDAGRQALAEHR